MSGQAGGCLIKINVTLITQLITMLHIVLVQLSAHYSWHYFDTQCLAHHSSAYVSDLLFMETKNG